MYTTYNPCKTPTAADKESGARTGRLSSTSPNLQQLPGHLHRLFIPRPGHKLATYDAAAIEPRLIAYYTEDPNLFRIVASGEDFHGHTTAVLFEQGWDPSEVKARFVLERKMGKECGLSFFYGAGWKRLQETAQKYGFFWSEGECKRKIERFKEYYRGVFDFRDQQLNPILKSGGAVTNLLGRQFRIADPEDVHMQGLNTLIQGSASDLVLESARRIMETFRSREIAGHVLLFVHDELVVEIPQERERECVETVVRSMTDYPLGTSLGAVPLLVEGKVADFWAK